MGKIGERVKAMIRDWLQIQSAPQQSIIISEETSFEANVIKNKIWYRGEAGELQQLYKQLNTSGGRFWSSVPADRKIRRIHSGLPSVIVDTLTYIVKADYSPEVFGDEGNADWNNIEKEIDFAELIGEAVSQTLVTGDGAFKISVDTEISPYPLCEFYPADRVKFDLKRGRVTAVRFYTNYIQKSTKYTLEEIYSKNKVEYHLFRGEHEVPLKTIKELSEYKPITFAGDFIMAVPFKIYSSSKYSGRGKSIFDNKTDDFDAHDEVISQWMDAVRRGRVQRYIPDDLIPRNSKGEMQEVGAFGADYIKIDSGSGNNDSEQKIQVVQPDINYEAYLSAYTSTLDMCLQGLLSPATLGIDLGKMSSADAQREKKDITGHTRNAITSALEKSLPKLISALLMTYDNMLSRSPGSYCPTVEFGEYGAPDFDSRVDVVNKAATAGTMSVEAQVEELWGDSKDKKWKEEEVKRINTMKGLISGAPPKVGDEIVDVE